VQNLERYRTVMPEVVREIDDGETTTSQLTLDPVPTRKRLGEGLDFGQCALRGDRTDTTLTAEPIAV